MSLRTILKALVRRWRLASLVGCGLLLFAYSGIYATVSLHRSGADRSVELPDDRRLAYRVLQAPSAADAARVLLVHGAPADSGSWERLLESQGATLGGLGLVAVDRLGYGASSPGRETSLAAHARSLEPLLGDGALLVGHSYGGPVVLRAAAEFPDRVRGVVLVAGACDPGMEDSRWFRRAVDACGVLVPEPWRVANAELLALTQENRDMIELLDRVRCPITMVHGRWDAVCPHDGTVAYLANALGPERVRVVSLPRAGHNLHLWRAEEVATAIATLAADSPER